MRNLHCIVRLPDCKVPPGNQDPMTMRSTTTRKTGNTARRIWEVFMTARTHQARQLLKNRGN